MNEMLSLQSAAYDIQSLSGLKRELTESPEKGLRQVTQQLEATFVQMMLKSMRSALPQDGLFNSEQTKMLTSMYDQQIAQDLSQKGLGFADMMYQQLSGDANKPLPQTAQLMPLDQDFLQTLPKASLEQVMRNFSPLGELGDALSQPIRKIKKLSLNSQNFVQQLLTPAKRASEKSGISHLLIIAQAALESGWGNREILTKNGQSSHNLFGIKAGKSWQGPTTNIMTTEVIDGKTIKMRDDFRVYGSYEEAIDDYIRLLTENPRYAQVAKQPTPEAAAKTLHQAGYATDPGYTDKLVNLINQIRGSNHKAISAYTHDLSELF